MLHTKFRGNRLAFSGEEDFEWFYHIWAWRPSWSCDQDPANKLLFPLPMDAPHKFGQAVSEKMFENVNGRTHGRTHAGSTTIQLYYKLTM